MDRCRQTRLPTSDVRGDLPCVAPLRYDCRCWSTILTRLCSVPGACRPGELIAQGQKNQHHSFCIGVTVETRHFQLRSSLRRPSPGYVEGDDSGRKGGSKYPWNGRRKRTRRLTAGYAQARRSIAAASLLPLEICALESPLMLHSRICLYFCNPGGYRLS